MIQPFIIESLKEEADIQEARIYLESEDSPMIEDPDWFEPEKEEKKAVDFTIDFSI